MLNNNIDTEIIDNKKNKLKGFSLLSVIIIVLITAIISGLTVGIIFYNKSKILYGNALNDSSIKELLDVYNSIEEKYYGKEYDKQGMVDQAIKAMLSYLNEDYTAYLDKDESSALQNSLNGTFKGIGVSISQDNRIVKVYEGPAKEAGIEVGDVIVEVNGNDVTNENSSKTISYIDKTKSTNEIVVKRGEEIIKFSVGIGDISTPLKSGILKTTGDKKIGYIYLDSFTKTSSDEIRNSLNDLKSEGMESLILDLRFNGGGYLNSVNGIASMFIEKGKAIYTLEDKNGNKITKYDDSDEKQDFKLVILTNGATASASEMLTLALKESYGAIVVGEKTYGKGRVQDTSTLSDGSMVKYTSSYWYSPSGKNIDQKGITPDYEVTLTTEDEVDTQVLKAIEILES